MRVYGKTGGDYLGTMTPPANLWNGAWIDTTNGMHAIQLLNGQYVLFMQEEVGAKVLVWTLGSTATVIPNTTLANAARYVAPVKSNTNTGSQTAFNHGYQPWVRQDNTTPPSYVAVAPVTPVPPSVPVSNPIVPQVVQPVIPPAPFIIVMAKPVATLQPIAPPTTPIPLVKPIKNPTPTSPVVTVPPATPTTPTAPTTPPAPVVHGTTVPTVFSYTPMIVGNTGGTLETHVQSNVGPNQRLYHNALATSQNGTSLAVCNWDEGVGEATLYKNGQVLARCTQVHGSATGITCAINNTYGFVPTYISPTPGYPGQYPSTGKAWFGIARIGATNGNVWPFQGGKGFTGILGIGWFMKFTEVPSTATAPLNPIKDNPIISMAASEKHLYAYAGGVLYDIDPDTMTILNQFNLALTNVGPMAVNPVTGDIWISRSVAGGSTIVGYTNAGVALNKPINLTTNPPGMAITPDGQTLNIADPNNDNIILYTLANGARTTFGTALHNANGVCASGRFQGIAGIGIDGNGGFYVAENRSLLDTFISAYQNGTQQWSVSCAGSEMTWGVDADDDSQVYDAWHRYNFGYDGTWSIAAVTVDPVRFPNDPRIMAVGDIQSASVVTIKGQKFLFADGAMYRKDPTSGSEIWIPAVIWNDKGSYDAISTAPATYPPNRPSGSWLWRNTAGDGQFNAGEFTSTTVGDISWAPYMDSAGTLWCAYDRGFIIKYPCGGVDGHGVPIYSVATSVSEGALNSAAPVAPFTRYMRFSYDPATDVAVIMGYTAALPQSSAMTWGMAGTVMAVYDHWTGAGGTRTLRYTVTLPTAPSTFNTDMVRSMWVSNSNIYCEMWQSRKIYAYKKLDGSLRGVITPGAAFTGAWQDMQNGLHGVTHADGTDWLFAPYSVAACEAVYKVNP